MIELAQEIEGELARLQYETKAYAYRNRLKSHTSEQAYPPLTVLCNVSTRNVRGHYVYCTTWFVNQRRRGWNAMLGKFREAGLL